MKFHYTLREQWEIIKPIWRVMLLVVLMQLTGGFVGIVVERYGYTLVDFWFGGAVATFPGFVLGSIFHEINSESKIKENKFAFLFVGGVSLVLTVAVFFMPLQEMAQQLQQS